MNLGQLHVSDAVCDALSPGVVERLPHDVTTFRCMHCGTDGDRAARDDASIIVIRHDDGSTAIQVTHAACAPSQVVTANEPFQPPTQNDITSMAALLPGADGSRPFLLLSRAAETGMLTPGGDMLDPVETELLQHGWTVFTRIGKTPPQAPGWSLPLDMSTGKGHVSATEGWTLVDRMPDLPPAWLQAVASWGAAIVVVGRYDLREIAEAPNPPQAFAALARTGRLVAATVGLSDLTDSGESDHPQALAEALDKATRERAHPDSTGPLASMANLVDLPTTPILTALELPDMAGVLVDLADPDPDRARQTLHNLKDAGIPERRQLYDGYLPLSPDDWGFLLWPSQLLVQAGRTDAGKPRKLVFAQMQIPPQQWYDTAKQSGALAVFVGYFATSATSKETITAAMAKGDVLAVTVAGMAAV